jgi:hypothetical protein
MTERTREAVFRGCAVLPLAAAAFHAAAIASPGMVLIIDRRRNDGTR